MIYASKKSIFPNISKFYTHFFSLKRLKKLKNFDKLWLLPGKRQVNLIGLLCKLI